MKLLKAMLASVLLVTLLAASAFAFPDRSTVLPNNVGKNPNEFASVEDILADLGIKAKEYTITTLKIEDYKTLWEKCLAEDTQLVEQGKLTKEQAKSFAKTYRDIYDEMQLDHGFVKRVERTDGKVTYKYHSKIDYYQFLGDMNRVFFTEEVAVDQADEAPIPVHELPTTAEPEETK